MSNIVPVARLPDLRRAREYAEASQAPGTKAEYARHWRSFQAWCKVEGVSPLPAEPPSVAAYISWMAAKYAAATIDIALAAIRWYHVVQKQPNPTKEPEVWVALAGIRRTIGTAPKRKEAATADIVENVLEECGDDLHGIRNRALIALTFGGSLRRSEAVALDIEDLSFDDDRGLYVCIRSSKTDQEKEGTTILIRNKKMRIMDIVRVWVDALAGMGITEGALFRSFSKDRKLRDTRLPAMMVNNIFKQMAWQAGYDDALLSAHSLRRGYITSASRAKNPNIFKIAQHTRHKNFETLRGYVQDEQLDVDHSGEDFL